MTLLSFPRRAAVRRCSALALAAVIVAGCGSDDRSSASSAATAPATTATTVDVDAFPVTIEHAFGSTVVPAEPQRVVVAGLNEADYLYSLGVRTQPAHGPMRRAPRPVRSPRCSRSSTSTQSGSPRCTPT